jgi:aerobic-type carbon monoxide dehydrogenase small subunit (CoxS/CutS family)
LVSPSPSQLHVQVNGIVHDVEAAMDTPLLYVLRENLGLNAAKYGCGLGRCGACAVHVEGEPVLSCQVTIGEVAGRRITTLEGLANADLLHPLQQAFLDEQAAQCGYCIPGIVMTVAALLEHNPHPSDAEIRATLEGTLCRCGSHVRILKAIHRVIEENQG